MNPGDLIIGKARCASFVVFKVLSVTRNGWLKVQHHSDQQGNLVTDGFICKFRSGSMTLFNGGGK
jgi:hypothetical protein